MAGGKFNYRVQAQLITKQFKIGAEEIRRELASLKSGIMGFAGALGASFAGLSVLSKMKDVAVNLNVARATLKNTSANIAEYGDNLKYVERLSKDYKQDLITLTSSFAKFHAASQGTNFSLQQQKEMYEGLVRAAAFYHLSTERTENMLLAVEQIMSKNKVTAEELRRQLGNVLPGAFNKMGQAAIDMGYAGVKSMADFEKAMKAGKIGADLLYQFVQNLNKETQNIDLTSLQLQLNELSNAFTRFTENSNFEEWFKGAVDVAIKGLDFIADHLKEITSIAKGFIAIWAGGKLLKGLDRVLYTIEKATVKFKGWKALLASFFDTIHYYILVIWDALKTFVGSVAGGVAVYVGAMTTMIGKVRNLEKATDDAKNSFQKLLDLANDPKVQAAQKYDAAQRAYNEAQEYFRKHTRDEYDRWKQTAATGKANQNLNGPIRGGMAPSIPGQASAGVGAVAQLKVDEWDANQRKLDQAVQMMTDAALEMGKGMIHVAESVTTINGGDEGTETDFEKLIKKYQTEIKELNNQFESGSITAQKYKEEAQDLAQKTWENVTAFDDFRGEIAKLNPELQKVAGELEKAFVNPYLHDTVTKLSDATKGYYEEVGRLNVLQSAHLIKNQEDYNDALQKAAEKAVEAMAGINGLANVIALLDPLTQQLIGNIISTYKKGLNGTGTPDSSKLSDLQAAYQEAITRPKVNHRFDYEKSQEEIIRAEAEADEQWAENIKKFKEKYANELSQLIKEQLDNIEKQAIESATNLTDLADVTKWLEDVKNLRKEFGQGFYGSVKDTAEAMDRLTSGAKSFKKTMEDTDSTVWDKILESINLLIQSIDTVISLVESYNTVSEISRNLSRAKNAEEMRALGTKLAGETGLISVKKIELAVDKMAEAQAKKNATASLAAGAANSAEAVGGAVASGAKMPFPQNIIAMGIGAATAAGLITGMVKMVKANFAGGGIVGGNSRHGDKVLAGLNSGEMILNGNQQSRLWGWLNGRGAPQSSGGGKVEFVISGSNLRGVLKNEERIRTGRS